MKENRQTELISLPAISLIFAKLKIICTVNFCC